MAGANNYQAPGGVPTNLSMNLGLSDPRIRRATQARNLLEQQYGLGIHVDGSGRLSVDIRELAKSRAFAVEIIRAFTNLTIRNEYAGDVIHEADIDLSDNSVTNNYNDYITNEIDNTYYTFNVDNPLSDPELTYFDGLVDNWLSTTHIGELAATNALTIGTGWNNTQPTILDQLAEITDPVAYDLGSIQLSAIIGYSDIFDSRIDIGAQEVYGQFGREKSSTLNADFRNTPYSANNASGSRTWYNDICTVAQLGLPSPPLGPGDYCTAGLWGLKSLFTPNNMSISGDEGNVYAYLQFLNSSGGVIESVSLFNAAVGIPNMANNIAFAVAASSTERYRWRGYGTGYQGYSGVNGPPWTFDSKGSAQGGSGYRRRIPTGTHRIRTKYQMNSASGSWYYSEYARFIIKDTFYYCPVIIRP